MKNLTVENVGFDLEVGFFWVEFNNGKSIQCCLVARRDGNGYIKQIDRSDCGSDEGVSYDVNNWALGDDVGFNDIEELLFKEARKVGIRIV